MLDNKTYNTLELTNILAKRFNLNSNELSELLPSGVQGIFVNRVGWAKSYLYKARLISKVDRGIYQISESGKLETKNKGILITKKYLQKHYQFGECNEVNDNILQLDPLETIERQFQQINDQLANNLLDKIMMNSPQFFENLIADLLIKMGYGSSKQDILQNSGKSGDGGIDGIINASST
jgi:restriction system protein